MALQASTLVDGAWTTTTIDVDDVLRAHNHEQEATNLMDVEKPPTIGILTQTVIRSPLVHWILPVRLRGTKIHDVAFIGVRYGFRFSSCPACCCLNLRSPWNLYLQVRYHTSLLARQTHALAFSLLIYDAELLIYIG
jgi:hypothetical protein